MMCSLPGNVTPQTKAIGYTNVLFNIADCVKILFSNFLLIGSRGITVNEKTGFGLKNRGSIPSLCKDFSSLPLAKLHTEELSLSIYLADVFLSSMQQMVSC